MKRFLYFFCFLAAAVFTSTQQVSAQKYKLAWKEEFKGTTYDPDSWEKIPRSVGEWARYMSNHPSLYEVRKGRLRLYAVVNNVEPADTALFLTGGLRTRNKHTVKYGKISIRAKIIGAQGTWPAIWTMPNDYAKWKYPTRAEIDILEYLHMADHVYQTLHSQYTDEINPPNQQQRQAKVPIRKNRYNTYTVEIQPHVLIFSVNGVETLRYNKLPEEGIAQYPYGIESYLMVDMQVGGRWARDIDPDTFPAYMDVDWVKFYDYEE